MGTKAVAGVAAKCLAVSAQGLRDALGIGASSPVARKVAVSAQRHLGNFCTDLPQQKVTWVRPRQGEEGTRGQSD